MNISLYSGNTQLQPTSRRYGIYAGDGAFLRRGGNPRKTSRYIPF